MRRISLCLAAIMGVTSTHAATFTIVNMDGVGEGLNDPTPVIPAGGNAATTLGAARLAVLQEAGRVWGLQLASSIPIVVEAKFESQPCSASSGTLGGAKSLTGFSNFAAAPLQNVVYPSALADSLAGTNIQNANDMEATFNSEVNGNASCLNSARFYLGFDHAPPTGTINLLNVALHEFAHGLGFASALDDDGTSQFTSGNLAAFDQFIYSETLGRFWPAMTAAERLANSTSGTQMVWNGSNVNSGISFLSPAGLSTAGRLKLYAPSTYDSGSSISHWDTTAQWNPTGSATRSLLMEPFITANPQGLTDITGCALRDMGWQGTRCVDRGSSNSPPTATAQTIVATEDTALQITLRGSDPDSTGPLIYSIVTAPARGALTAPASLVSSTGVVYSYTPSVNLNGTDTFTFQVSDGADLSLPATVTVNVAAVNDAPIATTQTLNTIAAVATTVTLTGSDVDGSAITYALLTTPINGTLSGTPPNFVYTGNNGFTGTDSFTFRVNDGVLNSASATVTINVIAPPAPAPTSSGGGGGSIDGFSLIALALFLLNWQGQALCRALVKVPRSGSAKSRRVWQDKAWHGNMR